jgi:hypothetical protein
MNFDIDSTFLALFKVAEGHEPLFLLSYPLAFVIAFLTARAARRWTRPSTRTRAAITIALALAVIVIVHSAFREAYIYWYSLDARCPTEKHGVVYLPLMQSAELSSKLSDSDYLNRTSCDLIYALIQQSGYGWASYLTIAVHLLLGSLLLALLGLLVFSLRNLDVRSIFDRK